jgi:hypothetical protein
VTRARTVNPSSSGRAEGQAREFEFDESHNKTFSRLAGSMRWVGLGQVVVAVVYVAVALLALVNGDLVEAAGGSATAVVILLIGVWTLSAGRHVRGIISTEGSDITHLMRAMQELVKLYALQRTILIIAVALAGLALLVNASLLLQGVP